MMFRTVRSSIPHPTSSKPWHSGLLAALGACFKTSPYSSTARFSWNTGEIFRRFMHCTILTFKSGTSSKWAYVSVFSRSSGKNSIILHQTFWKLYIYFFLFRQCLECATLEVILLSKPSTSFHHHYLEYMKFISY